MKTDDDLKFPSLFQTILDWKGLAVFSFFFSITLILYLLFALGVGHTIAFLNVRIGNVLNIISYLKITLLFVTTYIPRNEYYYANFVMLVIFIILLFVWLILISIAENKPRLEQNSHDYLLIVLAALVGICGFLYLVFGAINKNYSQYVMAAISYALVILICAIPLILRQELVELDINVTFDAPLIPY